MNRIEIALTTLALATAAVAARTDEPFSYFRNDWSVIGHPRHREIGAAGEAVDRKGASPGISVQRRKEPERTSRQARQERQGRKEEEGRAPGLPPALSLVPPSLLPSPSEGVCPWLRNSRTQE